MADYGQKYRFIFDSMNQSEIEITISQKDYDGESQQRSLGRAPILKREASGRIHGTSLELWAECQEDGEFAQFYTSDAREFLVEVYRDGSILWSGFISPELYSEPDLPPPYDVQLIATDGLGELKNYDFPAVGGATIQDHLENILSRTGQQLEVRKISTLLYNSMNSPFNLNLNINYLKEESCYDVLQRFLETFNAHITYKDGEWLLYRETDLMHAVTEPQYTGFVDIQDFGSIQNYQWWPIDHLSTTIEPAKKSVEVVSEVHYKDNALNPISSGSWTTTGDAYFDSDELCYCLESNTDAISQPIYFWRENAVNYPLILKLRAFGMVPDYDAGVYLSIHIWTNDENNTEYWLEEIVDKPGQYEWKSVESDLNITLESYSAGAGNDDKSDIEISIPVTRYERTRAMGVGYIEQMEVKITPMWSPNQEQSIRVYACDLIRAKQPKGYKADVQILNNARGKADAVELLICDNKSITPSCHLFQYNVPYNSEDNEYAVAWSSVHFLSNTFLKLMSMDHALSVALPRQRYTGVLNVPRGKSIPLLFRRDNTLYMLDKYSYDLHRDELQVTMTSVPTANVDIENDVIKPL